MRGERHCAELELRVWGAEVSTCREGRWGVCLDLRSGHHRGGQRVRVLLYVNQPEGGLGLGQLSRIGKRLLLRSCEYWEGPYAE